MMWIRSVGHDVDQACGPPYLYHNVHVFAVVQQTEVGVEVEPVVSAFGAGQEQPPLLQGQKEGLPPLGPQLFQERPLIGQDTCQSSLCLMYTGSFFLFHYKNKMRCISTVAT